MFVQTPSTEDASSPPYPRVVIVMSVSGCGKWAVGALPALRLQWEFEDADWFHPAANVDKMPPGLLHSRFETLEEPGPDENPVIVTIEPQPREIVAQILSALNMVERARSPKQISPQSSVHSA